VKLKKALGGFFWFWVRSGEPSSFRWTEVLTSCQSVLDWKLLG